MSYELFGDLASLVAVVQYRFAHCSRCCIFASLDACAFASLDACAFALLGTFRPCFACRKISNRERSMKYKK